MQFMSESYWVRLPHILTGNGTAAQIGELVVTSILVGYTSTNLG
jgi:hypothetical protein